MIKLFRRLLDGYGSFFALSNPLSQALILIAALLQPTSGLCGLFGGICVILWHRLLRLSDINERIELVNGILLGMLLGSLYSIDPNMLDARIVAITILAGLLIVLSSAVITITLTRPLGLPLLGLPYVISAYIILPVGNLLQLPAAYPSLSYTSFTYLAPFHCIQPFGALYFNGTALGGALVLLAFILSSGYLTLLALASSLVCMLFLRAVGVSELSTLFLVAQMNGLLTAAVIGGLYATPGKRSLIVALVAAVVACLLSLCLHSLLRVLGLPILALPFVITTYACLIVFGQQRTEPWTYFWLPVPGLPEKSLEQSQIARVRGIDMRSIALKLPVEGTWQIYQGFGGQHTHQGLWHYALDFFQCKNGRSFHGSGKDLCDYHCFSQPVFSPAFGTVVDYRSDIPDNSPGEVDLVNNWGNYIIIRLDCGLYLVLAHLQENTLTVSLQSRILPGQLIARCGNSGRSPQPHLHMHVQEGFYFGGKTIPFHLTGVLSAAGETKSYSLHCLPKEKEIVTAPRKNQVLRKALNLVVGNRFQFEFLNKKARLNMASFEVKLDGQGQFWLESATGTRTAFFANEEIVAFFNRNTTKDLMMDSIILAIGLTPFIEGSFTWQDAIPKRILPMSLPVRLLSMILQPFQSCTRSDYERSWDMKKRIWVQRGEHYVGNRIATWKYITEAHLCEAGGLVKLSVFGEGRLLCVAELMAHGLGSDNGIPHTDLTLLRAV